MHKENYFISKVSQKDIIEKYYILNMFPYPSGEGLHVGHPLGYVASDIYARYKKMKGHKVINPMGFDSFGLPAEQYAILTGQHPSITTEKNVKNYIGQLKNIDLDFDWERTFNTSDSQYYKWTQWIFIKMFNSFYCKLDNKAHNIEDLYKYFEKNGTKDIRDYAFFKDSKYDFTSDQWNNFTEDKKYKISLDYKIAYLDEIEVNWCEGLKTVLANDEVKNGVSERGGYPVIKKKMKQWVLRITAYADRLLSDLVNINWPESTKEIQRNWIGRSNGANIKFKVFKDDNFKEDYDITIFTSRPETIFGVTFIGLSKDHEFVKKYCNSLNLNNIKEDSDIKTGIRTGFYAINPINNEKIPIWIANYILGDYGTGAIMGVPQLDDRDKDFAEKYGIDVKYIFEDDHFINSDFLNGLNINDGRKEVIKNITDLNIREAVSVYRLRDAIFSRQRYWGEPIPIYYKEVNIDGNVEKLPFAINEEDLPLRLPDIDDFKPTGDAPLKRAKNWTYNGYELEVNTMPGWAGSSWYFLRYLDPKNDKEFCSKEKLKEFENVDLYLGGAEHAVGHLLYSRFYTKFLYDLGYINFEEPFKKLIHQGMILGESAIIYRKDKNEYVSSDLASNYEKLTPIHINLNFVDGDTNVDVDKLKNWRTDFFNSKYVYNENKKFHCNRIVEKMSKSKYNVINPDEIIEHYGSDVFRMYLMFLGPIEQKKPWNTKGIEGIARFLNRVNNIVNKVVDKKTDEDELKIINKCLKEVGENIENFSFNTAISSMMICLNSLSDLKNISKDTFKDFLLVLNLFAPKTVKNIWDKFFKKNIFIRLFKNTDLGKMKFPEFNEKYLEEDTMQYPIMINGTTRTQVVINKKASEEKIKNIVLNDEVVKKWILNKEIKKFIIVKDKIISIVL
jgi:leucyl-tRNA synthetase